MYRGYERRNSGYDWSEGMSNRAVTAYEHGAMPKSKWTKQALLNGILDNLYGEGEPVPGEIVRQIRAGLSKHSAKWLQASLLSYDSWHHTSSAYNRTDFWTVKDLTFEEYMEVLNRPEEKTVKPASTFRMVLAEFRVSIKARRGWSYDDVMRYGVSDGKWFYPIDGYMYYDGKKSVGGYHYTERPVTRAAIVEAWRKNYQGSIKGLKAWLGKYGL